jgi:hypothetical protein
MAPRKSAAPEAPSNAASDAVPRRCRYGGGVSYRVAAPGPAGRVEMRSVDAKWGDEIMGADPVELMRLDSLGRWRLPAHRATTSSANTRNASLDIRERDAECRWTDDSSRHTRGVRRAPRPRPRRLAGRRPGGDQGRQPRPGRERCAADRGRERIARGARRRRARGPALNPNAPRLLTIFASCCRLSCPQHERRADRPGGAAASSSWSSRRRARKLSR